MQVLTISYGGHLFSDTNDERARMRACALAVGQLHMVVFISRGQLCKETHDGALHLYPIHGLGIIKVFRALQRGYRILRDGAQWTVSSQDPFEAGFIGYILARTQGAHFNVQEHGDFFSTPHWRNESFKNRIFYLLGIWILRHADSVRVVSKRIKRTCIAHGVDEKTISILTVYSDLQRFRDALSDAPKAQGEIRILSAGRFVPQKNLKLLIEAFSVVYKAAPHTRLTLVGRGKEEEVIKNLIQTLSLKDVVTILPWTDSLPSLMKSADIFSLSSNYEGWARVLTEALASGLAVVSTDVGCANEAFIDREHGRVVPIDDASSFASALTELVKDTSLRQKYQTNGSAHILKSGITLSEYAHAWARVTTGNAF